MSKKTRGSPEYADLLRKDGTWDCDDMWHLWGRDDVEGGWFCMVCGSPQRVDGRVVQKRLGG